MTPVAMSLAAFLSAAAWPAAAVSVCLLERLGCPTWLGKAPTKVLFLDSTSFKSGKHPKDSSVN